jgi:hypothetical protein
MMASTRGRRFRRPLLAGVLVLAVVGVAFVVVRFVAFRDRSHAIPVSEAIDRYRAQSSTSSTADSVPTPTGRARSAELTAPAVGVYRYATTGRESIDSLGGATHDYPAETTITVTNEGCGVRLRWDALVERHDEWRLCATAEGIALQADGAQFHQFFGQPDDERVACDRAVVVVPIVDPAGSVPLDCTLGSDAWKPVWQVLERSTRDVDGIATELIHVQMSVNDDDDYYEHTMIDWYLDPHGLPVELRATKASRSPSPIGGVVYREDYTLRLESMRPLQ